MKSKSYRSKLLDPRWQRRRLEIMQRDDFACLLCQSEDKTLAVHHRAYLRGREPWDYPADALVTLCDECHKRVEVALFRLRLHLTFEPSLDILERVEKFLPSNWEHFHRVVLACEEKYANTIADQTES